MTDLFTSEFDAEDQGVIARRVVFATQYAGVAAPKVPCFVFTPNLPWQKPGAPPRCFSCGDALEDEKPFGRCWRCVQAMRQVLGMRT